MRILVTGAAGFIGSNIVEYHLNKGDIVSGIDDLSSGSEKNIKEFLPNSKFNFVKADILNYKELDQMVAKVDRIYHMAAVVGVYRVIQEPVRVLSVNIEGCELILKAIKNTQVQAKVLLASSAEVYGPSKKLPLSEDDNIIIEASARNRLNYAISKLANEAAGLSYFQKFSIPVITVRLFNTIGPRQTGRYGMVVPNFVRQAQANENIKVFGTGEQTRSFCDVRDTVVMLDLLMNNPKSYGDIVNVGNNREITINELARLVKKAVNTKTLIQHLSYVEAYGENYIDIQRRQPDLSKLFRYINFEHKYSLEDTISFLAKTNTGL